MGINVEVLGVGLVGEHLVLALRERKFPIDGQIVIMATGERSKDIFKGSDEHATI